MTEEFVIVKTKHGSVKGKLEESVLPGLTFYGFQSIPFAKPPVGDLRFKSPQPAEPWEGVKDCYKLAPAAPMIDIFTRQYVDSSQEDCLYLNVYTDKTPSEVQTPRPVMVSIHGGGFDLGTGNKDFSGPDYLVQHGVVLVTINYRVGALGFLSLQTSECPGNVGLKDQTMALRWVQDNIANFGGDANNVTIFGVSAGGASVHYLLLSPTTKGLFHRAIIQSGSVINNWAYCVKPRQLAFALGRRMGCDTQDDRLLLNFLQNANAKDIVLNSFRLLDEVDGNRAGEKMLQFPFVPTLEPSENNPNGFLTEDPRKLIQEGRYHQVPVILGACSVEGLFCLESASELPHWTTDSHFEQLVPRIFGVEQNTNKSLHVARMIRQHFFNNGLTIDGLIDVFSDLFFFHGVYWQAKCHLDNPHDTPYYLYVFRYEGGRSMKNFLGDFESIKGTAHGEDVGYLYPPGMLKSFPIPADFDDRDYHFMTKFTKLWTDFAKQDNFTNNWSKLTKEFNYLDINETFTMKTDYPVERMKFWNQVWEYLDKN